MNRVINQTCMKSFLTKENIIVLGIAELLRKYNTKIEVNGYKWVGKNISGEGGRGWGLVSGVCEILVTLSITKMGKSYLIFS